MWYCDRLIVWFSFVDYVGVEQSTVGVGVVCILFLDSMVMFSVGLQVVFAIVSISCV